VRPQSSHQKNKLHSSAQYLHDKVNFSTSKINISSFDHPSVFQKDKNNRLQDMKKLLNYKNQVDIAKEN